MEEKFDAIIVGAGPAGCACAIKTAQNGLRTLLLERGKFPGAKNMWGGAFYGQTLATLVPSFWEEAPFERFVARHRLSLLAEEDSLSAEFSSPKHSRLPYNGVTLLRSKFDRWFADKAQQAGAMVVSGLAADELLREGKKIAGVIAGGDKFNASVVVACDGVNSIIAQKAGLRGELKAHEVKQGVKEVLQFPRKVLEQRFNLTGDEGIAWEFVGSCTGKLPGGGFIYTNKDSLSIGIVVQLSALAEKKVAANDLLDNFKKHPAVARMIEGGKLVEYSAHLIPAAGLSMAPELYTDGLIVAGDAASLVLSTGLNLEGANFAVASGVAAAETILRAKQKEDFSAGSLAYYSELLGKSFVMSDLKTFSRANDFLKNPGIYSAYPDLACSLADKIFTREDKPRKTMWKLLRETMKGKISFWQVLRDLIQMKRSI